MLISCPNPSLRSSISLNPTHLFSPLCVMATLSSGWPLGWLSLILSVANKSLKCDILIMLSLQLIFKWRSSI